MPLPVQDAWISQGFGPTEEKLDGPYAGYDHFNKGIDFAASAGTPVSATAGGKVISAGDSGDGWGLSVKIRDASGYTHNYGHLSAINVKAGDTVGEGTNLGKVGSTGKSTGPHLSYDVWDEKGTFVNPDKWVNLSATESTPEEDAMFPSLSGGGDRTEEVEAAEEKRTLRSSLSPDEARNNYRDAATAWSEYFINNERVVKDGRVWIKVPKEASESAPVLTVEDFASTMGKPVDDPKVVTAHKMYVAGLPKPDEDDGYELVEDNVGTRLYQGVEITKRAYDWSNEDAKLAKEKTPAVRTYLETEGDKTSEIKRQYEDFQDRATFFYDLRDKEDAAIRQGNQYNQQMATAQSQNGGFGFSDVFVGQPSGSRLSDMLRPSIPEYVTPDYRLNGAVGLPGEEGFDDQDFNQWGMPYYSEGTQPVRQMVPRTPDMIPPELRAMLGKPSIPMPRSPNTPQGIPYNGPSQRVRALVAAGRAR